MYVTRWATLKELAIVTGFWENMANEMGEIDNIPKPDLQRVAKVKSLFIHETKTGNLKFRVAVDKHDSIVACAGGLLRMEYSFPLAEKESLFGWIIAVYTLEQHRNNGLAHKLVNEVCFWLSLRKKELNEQDFGQVPAEEGFMKILDLKR